LTTRPRCTSRHGITRLANIQSTLNAATQWVNTLPQLEGAGSVLFRSSFTACNAAERIATDGSSNL
jgi:hypothetical protein